MLIEDSDESVEILLHNVSHSDLVLSLNNLERSLKQDSVIARPKFNFFKNISEYILKSVKSNVNREIDTVYRQLRTEVIILLTYDYLIIFIEYHLITKDLTETKYPVGYDLTKESYELESIFQLRFRRDDKSFLVPESNSNHVILVYLL